jgi:hypothetical protein
MKHCIKILFVICGLYAILRLICSSNIVLCATGLICLSSSYIARGPTETGVSPLEICFISQAIKGMESHYEI